MRGRFLALRAEARCEKLRDILFFGAVDSIHHHFCGVHLNWVNHAFQGGRNLDEGPQAVWVSLCASQELFAKVHRLLRLGGLLVLEAGVGWVLRGPLEMSMTFLIHASVNRFRQAGRTEREIWRERERDGAREEREREREIWRERERESERQRERKRTDKHVGPKAVEPVGRLEPPKG